MKNLWQIKDKKFEEGNNIFRKIVCPNKQKKVIRACCSDQCNKPALMCNGQQCQQCYKNHQKCLQFINFSILHQKLAKNSYQLFEDVLKFYLNVMRTALKQYNQLLSIVHNYSFCGNFQIFVEQLYKNSKGIKPKRIAKVQQDLRASEHSQIQVNKRDFLEFINLKKYEQIIDDLKQPKIRILQYKTNYLAKMKVQQNVINRIDIEPCVQQMQQQNQKLKQQVYQKEAEREAERSQVQKIRQNEQKQQQMAEHPKNKQQKKQEKSKQKQGIEDCLEQKQQANQSQVINQQIKKQQTKLEEQFLEKGQLHVQVKDQQIQNKQVDSKKEIEREENEQQNKEKEEGSSKEQKSIDFEEHIQNEQMKTKQQLGVKMTQSVQQAKHTESMIIEDGSYVGENSVIDQSTSSNLENSAKSAIIQNSENVNTIVHAEKANKKAHNKFLNNQKPTQQKHEKSSQDLLQFSLIKEQKTLQKGVFEKKK